MHLLTLTLDHDPPLHFDTFTNLNENHHNQVIIINRFVVSSNPYILERNDTTTSIQLKRHLMIAVS